MQRNGTKPAFDSDPSDDICPVCKSNRYLNPTLQFLINPECYHKMCSTCVDRIFTSGPASCPVPYCGKTLRKRGFHKAFFADLKVEREVDIRKRVGAVFNRRQDEFETLLDWNNYLEKVESLVFDLVEGSKEERAKAEEELKRYKESNLNDIEENRKSGLEEAERERRREKMEREAAKQRRLAAIYQEQEEKMDIEKSKRDVLDRLATSSQGNAKEVVEQAHQINLKKSARRRLIADENNDSLGESLTLRGLKKKESPKEEKPYDPFGGVDLTPTRYVLQDDYESEWLSHAKADPRHKAGGYSLHEYYARTMFEAFSGLGVFVEDEVASRSQPIAASSAVGTAGAAQAAKPKIKIEHNMEVDDVF